MRLAGCFRCQASPPRATTWSAKAAGAAGWLLCTLRNRRQQREPVAANVFPRTDYARRPQPAGATGSRDSANHTAIAVNAMPNHCRAEETFWSGIG